MINIRLTYLVELRMISLSVLFHDRTSSFYFLRKLLEFRAFTNSLDHLDCSLGALAVFMIKIFISGICPIISSTLPANVEKFFKKLVDISSLIIGFSINFRRKFERIIIKN